MTNTCINYQTILPPVTRGEHRGDGRHGGRDLFQQRSAGARSNFEGGPSALAAGLTGRTPRYGFHLEAHRAGTRSVTRSTRTADHDLADWGALGGVIGKLAGNYWSVPVVEGLQGAPGSDAMKHFGAAMASFGSIALFHLVGITPEANRLADVGGDRLPVARRITQADVKALQSAYATTDEVDVVVFSAPQVSLYELRQIAELCEGRRLLRPLLAMTSPQVKPDSDRMGYTERIEAAGGHVMTGMCFYQSYAREMAEANGWKRLATNSAKLVNILGGYGYVPLLATMEQCVDAAETGRLA